VPANAGVATALAMTSAVKEIPAARLPTLEHLVPAALLPDLAAMSCSCLNSRCRTWGASYPLDGYGELTGK
jgi:hypothetical protein